MSQEYHQGVFNFSNGFERSPPTQQQQQHMAQQIRRDKLGFDPPPPLVGIEHEESGGGIHVNYETAGMLSEMFNFPSGGATELLENQMMQSYRNPRAAPSTAAPDWFSNTRVNADSAAAMHLFLMNPPQQQQRPPSPCPSHPTPCQPTSSTLHMLLPNPPGAGDPYGQFTWVDNPNGGNENNNPSDIPNVLEGQGLSLSLSSSLQHLGAAKSAEELRMGGNNMIFFGQGVGESTSAEQHQFKSFGGGLNLLGGIGHAHQVHVGLGSSSSSSTMHMLRNSKYAKAAQELLEEFCSIGRGQFKKHFFARQNNNDNENPSSAGGNTSGGGSSSSSKDVNHPLSSADRIEQQRRKVKLLSMLDEVDRRYNHYCDQMQMLVNSFDMVMGFGSAVPYTSLAQKAMSRHFRCLKDAIGAQIKHSCEVLGEKDASGSGVTKGETPRLRMLEQSLRQQRAFHQMGMMGQDAWRPQRGLPERSVNILRAWLFEHFLHPYPSDADKHLLARQTGLSRNQVSNWFINARVRLWKPMVEEMYQQEAKDDDHESAHDHNDDDDQRDQSDSATAQTPTPHDNSARTTTTGSAAATTPPPPGQRIEAINAHHENDPSLIAINTPRFISDNHAHHNAADFSLSSSAVRSTAAQSFAAMHESGNNTDDIEATLIRFGTSAAGDISLTLGLRHAGNMPEKGHFSVRDFGGC